ncbi:SwmB domain-containing protein, partial [Azospirillum brasilense]|uniref:SwmB domain-containing protein n=1 Tax=Azospirillum brasilense TaxID=192 RepID=UPI0013B39A27
MLHPTVSRPVPAILGCEGASEVPRLEVAFIDTALDDWQALEAGTPAGIEVVLIDSRADGMTTMARALDGRRDIHAIHVLSHGFEGGLQLGSGRFDTTALAHRVEELASIASSLAPDGDILLYGCNVAAGHGPDFLKALGETTGANVAASRTPTGAAERGGDWDLDWVHGAVATESLRFEGYRGIMAAPVLVSWVGYVGESTITLTFDSALDSSTQPALTLFQGPGGFLEPSQVQINGAARSVSSAVVSGNTLTLTLQSVTLTSGDIVDINYYDPSGDDSASILQGSTGEDVAGFSKSVLVASGRPGTAPTLTATGTTGTQAQGDVNGVDLFSSVTALTNDSNQTFTSLELTVTGVSGVDSEGLFATAFGLIPLTTGTHIGLGAGATASATVSLAAAQPSGYTATVVINGSFTESELATLIDNLQYHNATGTQSVPGTVTAGDRVISITGVTDDGGSNNTSTLTGISTTVTVTALPPPTFVAPTLTATGTASTFTSYTNAVDLFSTVTADTNDTGQLFTSLTFTVTGVLDGASEMLVFMVPGQSSATISLNHGATSMPVGGVTASTTVSGGVATVTISGLQLTNSEMASFVDGIAYNNIAVLLSSTPSDGQRIITLSGVTDNGGSSNSASLTGITTVVTIGAAPTPVLQSAAVNGASLVLTYDTALDAVNVPSTGSFTVMAGGSPVTVSGVAVDTATKTVTLTLAQPVAYGAVVTVSYTDPTVGDDANAIQSFGGGLDAATFAGQSVTNTTPDPNGVPPTLALTAKDGGFQSGQGSGGTDLFDGVTASTVDSGQTFTGMVLTVHNVGGTGSTEFLSIGGTDIALSNGSSGSFASGNYAVTLANGVATVTLSGMALSNGGMDTLIDGIAYKNTGSSSVAAGSSETRSVVLRSITDSGASANTTVIDKVATVSIANTSSYSPFLTVVPTNPSVTFTPGTPQQVSFTLTATQAKTLVGSNVIFGINAPSGWSVGSATLSPTITGIVNSGDTFTLTFDVMSSGTDTTGAFPISIYSMSTGIDLTNSAISSSVMVTLANPPVVQSATVNGTTLVLTYDKDLDAANPPAAGAFEVKVGGTTVSVSNVAVDGVNKTVTLTLAQGVTDADTVTVAYTDPTTGNDASAVQATNGDDAASFTARPVTNNSPDTTPPSLVSATVNGTTLTLTYSEALDGAADAAGSAFTVMVNGVARTVTAADASGTTVTLTLDSAVERYQTVTVGYTPPGSGAKTQDVAGNAAAAVTGREARNVTAGEANFILLGTNPFGLVDIGSTARPTLVDIDGDGDLDLVTGSSGSSVQFYRNVGTSAAPSFTFVGTNPYGLVNATYGTPTFGDLDGDGDLDLLLGNGSGLTVVYRNVGTATAPSFTMVGTSAFGIGQVGGGYAKAALWDLDGDGDLDLLLGGNDGSLTVYRNVGTSASPSFTVVGTNPFGLEDVGFASTPSFVDIDNDGDLDVLVGNFDGNTVVFRNVGTNAAPSFTLVGTNPFGLGDVGTAALPVFADLDGDGDLDALIGNGDGNFVVYLQGPPPPAAPSAVTLTAGTNTGSTADTITANTAPTITGSAVPLSEVVLYDGAAAIGTVTADSLGQWTLTTGTLAEGLHTLTAKSTSAYYTGTSAASTALSVTIDTTGPTLASARLNGTTLTLTYSEALDGAQAPTGAFAVLVGGVARTVSAVAVSGRTVTLTLDAGATPYQSVTVDYTPPGSGAKTADAAGNAAGALSGRTVTVVGDPTFTLEGTNPFGLGDVGDNATPIFVDIDGDGDLDALVGNFASKIVFYRNVGTATQPTFSLVGTNPFGLNPVGSGGAQPTFADLDGDGRLDALVGTAGGNTYFYRNVGTATAPTFTLEGSNPFGLSRAGFGSSVELADIDGDGDLDALIGVDDGHTVFYRNVGTATQPTFTLEATNPFGLGNVGFSATPKLLDIDGDGDLDALIGNGDGQTFFYRNVGTAAAPTFVLEGTNPFGLGDVGDNATPIFVDIDGDGDLDALIGNTDGNTVLFRNGPPRPAAPDGLALTAGSNSGSTTDTLTKITTPTITGTAEASATVVLYDGATVVGTATADGAGLWTITSASLSDGAHSLTAKANTANGASAASTALSVTIDTAAPTLTSAVLSGTQLTLTYSELLDGAQAPAGAFTVLVGGVARTVTAVATDGRAVILTLDAGASSIYEGATVSYTPPGSGAKTVDVAGNAAGALNGQPVRVGGDPSFVLEATNPFGIGSFVGQSAPVFVDIDGDGDLDAVVGDWYANIVVYRNVGTATAPSFTLVGTNPFGLNTVGGGMPAFAKPALADIDGDGDLDLLAGNAGGDIVVYRNVGTATAPSFTLAGTNPFGLSNAGGFASPSLADIDGDGDLDALVGNANGDTLFYRNVGTATAPTFTLEATNPFGLGAVGSNATPIFVDIDGDGDLDALIGNDSGNTVLYRNIGTAASPTFTLEGTNPFNLGDVGNNAKPTFADIDGDGDLDALIGRDDGKTVLYRNNTPPPATPTAPTLTAGSNSGSTADTLTNVATPMIVGTAAASSTVVLYDGATAIGTVTADASTGLWTLSTASLSDGTHSLTVTSSNVHGTSSASTALSVTIDTAAPTLTSAVLSGTQLTLTYSELLDGAQTPTGAFTVLVGGVARTVTGVATSGKTVTLTLDAGVMSVHQTVTIDYTPPGSGAKMADAAGNAAGALTGYGVTVPKDPNFALEGTNPFGLNANSPWSIPTFADIDGDGDLDAVIGMSDGTILFYRNDGSATTPSFTLAGTNPFGLSSLDMNASPTFVDIDGNGTLDALIGDFNGNTVVYRNVGTATAPTFTLVGTNPFGLGTVGTATTPSFVDIDGDGDLDALIGNYDGNVVFYRNVGSATAPSFTLAGTNPFGLDDVGSYAQPIFQDIDGDGDLDALIGNYNGDMVFYRNVGSATAPSFTLESTNPFGLENVTFKSVPSLVDIDGDGDLDLLAGGGGTGNSIILFRNLPTAPGGLTLTAGSNSGSAADTLTNVTSPAITGQAQALSTVVLYDGAVAVGTATADAGGLWTVTSASLSDGTHSLTAVTIDSTGTSAASTALSVTIDTRAPTLTSATLSGTQLTLTYAELLDGAQTPSGAFTVLVGGVARTVTGVATNGKTVTLTLDAGATVYQSVTVDYTPPGSGAKTADAAGNAAGALTGQTVRVASDPSFVLEATNPFGLSGLLPQSKPVFVDIDGDGDLDALVGNIGVNFQFYRNVGSATAPSFTLEAATAPFGLSGTTMSTPTFADLDGDGDLDVLVGNNSGNLLFLRNVGTATAPSFTLEATNPFGLSNAPSLASPVIADLDGDGALDILIGTQGGDLLYYRNVGTATAPSFTLAGTNPFGLGNAGAQTSPTMVDLDGDGDLDVLIGNILGDTVVYRNVGTATAPSFTLVGTNPFGLSNAGMMGAPSLVDIDGDGDLDALVGNFASLVLFRNIPPTPADLALTTASNSGSTTDAVTNVTAPAITGLAKAFSTVVLYEGATALGTVTADANGLWTVTTASLGEGAHSLTAVSSDASGTSPASGTLTVTIDSVAPNAPSVTTALSNSATPTIAGTAETGSTVTVTVGGATYTTTATGGTWSIDLATATPTAGSLSLNTNGSNPVSATATDTAGNVSTPGTQTLVIDTTAPNAPAVTSAALTNSATPTIGGTAEAGSTVTVTVGGATYTTTATGGTWSIDLATATPASGSLSLNANGANPVSATATDAAGNTSTAGTQSLTVDTTAPNAPAVTSAALTNSATPTIAGTAEAGSTVTVTVGGATYTTTATNGGAWSIDLATATPTAGSLSLNANGANPVSATATDAAGNVSTPGTQSLTVDTTAPNAPTVTTALSNSATPTIAGTAETGSTVTVTIGGATYTTTATGGTWSIDLATATPTAGSLSLNANGANPVSATATDAAGNTSTAGTQTLTIDTTAPNAPAVTSAALTNSTTPTIAGTAEAGSTVIVTVGGATYTTTATNGGAWSIDLATATPTAGSLSLNANGANPVSATATDAAGNTSTAGTQTLTVDTTAPNAPTVTTALSNSTTPTLTGTAEAGSTVTVTVGGATYTTTATGGNWSIDLATA